MIRRIKSYIYPTLCPVKLIVVLLKLHYDININDIGHDMNHGMTLMRIGAYITMT